MITNRVYKLNKDFEVIKGLSLKVGQELEVVTDVVYMGGFPLPPEYQKTFLNLIKNNPKLFIDDTRNW